MGKYLPIIMTARCGSLNKAAGQLGYSHPSLWYIINNMEDDLGVKLFHRTKRGVTLTDAGRELLEIMVGIEEQEEKLYRMARSFRENLIQLGVFPSVAAQWMPELLAELSRKEPEVMVKLETPRRYADGAEAIADHALTCCFSILKNPPGLDCFPLYDDPYLLVVGQSHALANRKEATLTEAAEYPLIPCGESFDPDSPLWGVCRTAETVVAADSTALEPQLSVALAERGLGVSILPELALGDLARNRQVRVIPLAGGFHRTITLLCQKKARRTPLENEVIKLILRFVEDWRRRRAPEETNS